MRRSTGTKESKQGRVNFICLTGTRLGKHRALRPCWRFEGFFFSTPVHGVINDDVVQWISKISATITSNSDVVTQAQQIYSKIHNTDCKWMLVVPLVGWCWRYEDRSWLSSIVKQDDNEAQRPGTNEMPIDTMPIPQNLKLRNQ